MQVPPFGFKVVSKPICIVRWGGSFGQGGTSIKKVMHDCWRWAQVSGPASRQPFGFCLPFDHVSNKSHVD